MPEPQVEVVTRAGRHRFDFAWKEEKVALEFDGKTKYFDYSPQPRCSSRNGGGRRP